MITRSALCVVLALFYAAAGIGHFLATDALVAITPDWVPAPRAVVRATGAFEIAAALALLPGRTRRAAGIALALYALCVWPANWKHALQGVDIPGLPSSWWYHAPRLVLQPVIIWWSLYATDVIDWPWKRPRTNA